MYPAHILESGEIQTVREHCRSTAELAARALRPIWLGFCMILENVKRNSDNIWKRLPGGMKPSGAA